MQHFIKYLKLSLFGIAVLLLFIQGHKQALNEEVVPKTTPGIHIDSLYKCIFKNHQLDKDVFQKAYLGFTSLETAHQLKNDSILTIIDFSRSSNEKRFFVIDVKNKKLLIQTLVAHGQNSGLVNATEFSNSIHSHKSSLGFFITDNTYYGKHGLSLRLDGVEEGINDNARQRAIVIHAANYVSQKYIQNYGRIGRSFGCPALPVEDNATIIQLIKDKSCVFAYHPSYRYDAQPGNSAFIASSSFE